MAASAGFVAYRLWAAPSYSNPVLRHDAPSRDDGAYEVAFAGSRLRIDHEAVARRPGLAAYETGEIVIGIRPEDMEDAALAGVDAEDRRMKVIVDVREAMGSEVYAHFKLDAPPVVTEDTRELAIDTGEEALEDLEQRATERRSDLVARLGARTSAAEGHPLEFVVDTRNLHLFDPQTGEGIYH